MDAFQLKTIKAYYFPNGATSQIICCTEPSEKLFLASRLDEPSVYVFL